MLDICRWFNTVSRRAGTPKHGCAWEKPTARKLKGFCVYNHFENREAFLNFARSRGIFISLDCSRKQNIKYGIGQSIERRVQQLRGDP